MGLLHCPVEFTTPSGIPDGSKPVTVGKRHLPVQPEFFSWLCVTEHRPLQAINGFFLNLPLALAAQNRLGVNVVNGYLERTLYFQRRLRCKRPP